MPESSPFDQALTLQRERAMRVALEGHLRKILDARAMKPVSWMNRLMGRGPDLAGARSTLDALIGGSELDDATMQHLIADDFHRMHSGARNRLGMTLLELGGGTKPHPRADIIIDLHHPRTAPAQDATITPWQWFPNPGQPGVCPVAADSVDEVFASHFMEHIPRGQALIDVMNEAHRILKPGGTFTMVLPLVGFTNSDGSGELVAGWQPYSDPTHVNYWWFPEGLLYFCDGPFKPHADYGIREWAALGAFIEPSAAHDMIARHRNGPVADGSVWSVTDGWQGIATLVKP